MFQDHRPAMSLDNRTAREILAFYLAAGADALVGEEPVDRMADDLPPEAVGVRGDASPDTRLLRAGTGAEPRTQPRSRVPSRPQRARPASPSTPNPTPAAPPPPELAIMAAREAASGAGTLDELRTLLDSFQGCALSTTATQVAFADGNPKARVMFVGEAPGYEEDVSGLPFVGRSGKLLDRMMAAIALDRSKVYIANVVPWRPPGNRTPTPQETAICLPFIRRQIELADPDILVCLGQPATQTLLGTKEGITRTRGRWFKYPTGSREIRALATYHPAFLLRSPLQKRLAWRDFLALKKALQE
jgi:uracil-DNA glycosylase